jgi:CHAD domain-containing protein
MEALRRIIKDRDYHVKQIEENLMKIQDKLETIEMLEQANKREMKLVEEYEKIIELIKMDIDFAESIPNEKQPIPSISEVMENDNLPLSE